jgi:hypothetical protein
MICYKNWIKTEGAPTGHVYVPKTQADSCTVHSKICQEGEIPLIYVMEFDGMY